MYLGAACIRVDDLVPAVEGPSGVDAEPVSGADSVPGVRPSCWRVVDLLPG